MKQNDLGAHPADIPQRRLPWSSVASMMKNERLYVDYARRWPIIVRNATIQRYREQGEKEGDEALDAALQMSRTARGDMRRLGDQLCVQPTSTSRRIQLIDALIQRCGVVFCVPYETILFGC